MCLEFRSLAFTAKYILLHTKYLFNRRYFLGLKELNQYLLKNDQHLPVDLWSLKNYANIEGDLVLSIYTCKIVVFKGNLKRYLGPLKNFQDL